MIIAIDPGKNGAIAYQHPNEPKSPTGFNWHTIGVVSMPSTEQEIVDLFKHLESIAPNGQVIVYLEKVHAMPGQGVTSMFTFGHGYGFLRGVIQTLGIRLIDVTPQKWQKELGMIGKDKDDIYQFVRQTYPTVKCNKKQADAMGILHYALAVTYLDKQKT